MWSHSGPTPSAFVAAPRVLFLTSVYKIRFIVLINPSTDITSNPVIVSRKREQILKVSSFLPRQIKRAIFYRAASSLACVIATSHWDKVRMLSPDPVVQGNTGGNTGPSRRRTCAALGDPTLCRAARRCSSLGTRGPECPSSPSLGDSAWAAGGRAPRVTPAPCPRGGEGRLSSPSAPSRFSFGPVAPSNAEESAGWASGREVCRAPGSLA